MITTPEKAAGPKQTTLLAQEGAFFTGAWLPCLQPQGEWSSKLGRPLSQFWLLVFDYGVCALSLYLLLESQNQG